MTDRDLRGAELARRFFTGVVEPLLSRALPGLGYAAARLGETITSVPMGYGPRAAGTV